MFRQLTPDVLVSPQITPEHVAEAKALGVTFILNNRPDDEADDQPAGALIEAMARDAGLGYAAVPVSHAGFAPWQIDGMAAALEQASGGLLLAYCRSGTRSTLLWALTCARAGGDCDELAATAARAGYDVAPVRQIMDALAAGGH